MAQNNYTYGSGLINSDNLLFFTPKKLNPEEYDISIDLDVDRNIYFGSVKITWVNESQIKVGRLCIDRGIILESNMEIESINGEPPNKTNIIFSGSFILLDFPEFIKTGDKISISIKFSAELPKSNYHGDDIYEFRGHYKWYPKLHWDEKICATCTVTFCNITEGYQIFAVGQKNGNVYTEKYVANYYGFAISKKMKALSKEICGVTASVVYYQEYKECAEFMLDNAISALEFFIDFVGFYPYKSFIILTGSNKWTGGGNFSSGIVFVHNFEKYNRDDNVYINYYKALVPHEIGHQYFWEYVLESENPGWLGLGLSLALDREYTQYKLGIKTFHKRMIEYYMEYVNQKRNTTIMLSAEEARRALNDDNNEYGDNYHGNICHGKSFSIMSMLIDIIGKETYFNAMRYILNEFAGRSLYTEDFIKICEDLSGISLKWFFNQWLKSNRNLSFSIENINETEAGGINTTSFEVVRNGSLSSPVCLTVYYEDGSSQTQFVERLINSQYLSFNSKSKYSKIAFDPSESYAMIKSGVAIKNDCAELLIMNIKDAGYTDKFGLSLGYYERYKKINVEDDWAKTLLVMQLFDGRHYTECLDICEDIINDKKDSRNLIANMYRWIGMCYDLLNNRENAIGAYKQALSYEEVQFGDKHDQYGVHITREWIKERLASPFVRQ